MQKPSIVAHIQKMLECIQRPATYGSELENYISSKNPTTTAEVEYWIRQYDQNQKGWSL